MMRRTNTNAEPTPTIEYPYPIPERSYTAPTLNKPAHTLVTPATSLNSGESPSPRPVVKQRLPTPTVSSLQNLPSFCDFIYYSQNDGKFLDDYITYKLIKVKNILL